MSDDQKGTPKDHDGCTPPPPGCVPIVCPPGLIPAAAAPAAPAGNMVISGPAIVQAAPPPAAAPLVFWKPDACCPSCGQPLAKKDDHAHAKPLWKLPEDWNVPPSVCNELKRLHDLAYNGDAPAITLGACRSMLQVLFAQLPAEVINPPARKPTCLERIFGPPPLTPSKSAKAVLKRARDKGYITYALQEAGDRLPLDPADSDKGASSNAKQFVAFLRELTDTLHAQPSRLA